MRKSIIILSFIFISISAIKAEGFGIGASAIYNLQTESFGAGLRLNFKPNNLFRIIPQASYYPSFNKIHEYYVGLGLELNLFKIKNYNFYLLAYVAYNGWLNYETSNMKDAKYSNWAMEGGGGIVRNTGCWRPFVEYRYNGWFRETNFRLGVMYVMGCNKKGFSNNKRKRSVMTCPAYD